ncbi:hypothetical protein RDI86_01370 [Cellulosimicrobium sp. XJ-DQ-B-000]|uniref:hypothetical protein n=1 Tax=Cellulosimicrobium sp. XJ-DQ-B-000 TaxID=3072182 RepID=UPI00280A1B25|nr:hypothetical protein [Cellulosimicrobium sp. XJ-DQ-B-000]MDQ8040498.1 hypothetical protein [Cellulosimicrobium sp. XJ-DQ-B-000]
MTTTITDRVPVGTRVRCTDGATATVVDHRDKAAVGRAYDYVIRLDKPDADGNRIQFAARDDFEPIDGGTTTGHRPAVAAVPDVCAVVAENGGTTLVAPPPQARRAYSPDSLASLLVGTPPGVAHQVDVEHAVRIATLESILAESRQETQRAQDALVVERAKAEAFAAELAAERDVRLTAERRAAANGAALLAARPVVDAARELVDQWANPDGSSLRESALSTALTVAVRAHAEATR